jgi:prepilin-type N-terminal cleavage/methylation domain-containing protein
MRTPNLRGFSLFEVVIAVALVALLAVAVAPPIMRSLNQGRVSRAQSDARVIGNALLNFYKDVGQWPVQTDRDPEPEVDRLVGNAGLGGGNKGIAGGDSQVKGARTWDSFGEPSSISHHLIRNHHGNIKPLYTVSERPFEEPGWNGPYLDTVPLDPWGHPFVVNICFTHPARSGHWSAYNEYHNIMVVSAGPNGLFETPFDPNEYPEELGGDDVGFVVRGATRFR